MKKEKRKRKRKRHVLMGCIPYPYLADEGQNVMV
jgi:hypothetical protein